MSTGGDRTFGALAGFAALAAGGLMALDAISVLDFDRGWCASLALLVAGLGLLTVAAPSRAMYAGALARALPEGGPRLWGLRAITVLLAPAAGAGPVAYGLLSLVQAVRGSTDVPPPDWRRTVGTGTVGLAFMIAATELSLTLGSDTLLWPVLFAASALSIYWWTPRPSTRALIRAAALAAVPGFLLWSFWSIGGSGDGSGSGSIVPVAAAGALAVTLIFAPRWIRTSRALEAERVEQARAAERSDVAGMVHDSVLQTLALIQTRADDPTEVKALARRQERDLRARLFDSPGAQGDSRSIATALRAVAAEVEDAHLVKIDVVTLGDAQLDERSEALVAAAREALFNAAKHAGDAPISLFGEVDERGVTAYVRDRGPGFDLEAIPADRRGVRDSIVARMVRLGGHAAVRTAPGGGCEVRLVLERRR